MITQSPAELEIAAAVVGLILYAFIWFASRNLSRFAKVLARLAPIGLILMAIVAIIGGLEVRAPAPKTAAPPMAVEPSPDRVGAARPEPPSAPKREIRVPTEDRPAAADRPVPPAPSSPSQPTTAEAPPPDAKTLAPTGGSAPPPVAQPAPDTAPSPPRARRGPPAPKATETMKDAANGSGPPPGVAATEKTDWDVVPVFYGTDRNRKDEPKRISYTSERAHRLELGRALVTVPKTHQVPNIERPFAIRVPYLNVTIYEQAEDPKQHFTMQELKVLTREQFLSLVRERIAGSQSFKDQAVVFVHGYNTSFDYAVYRTAQMAYDLKFDGASFLYSWPSAGDLTGYYFDRESATQAEPYLRDFLELVTKETGAKSVSVIAHSMGNLPLLSVLPALAQALPPDVRLNQIILAAPDVDRDVFANLARNIKQYGRGITLYCSSNDVAMEAARRIAGGIPRAGDVPPDGPLVIAGIDTIDVSRTSTDYLALNHSTYAEKSALLNDIGLLLQTGERPPDRRIPILQRIATPNGDFWRYPAQ
ncbi:MAG TPA: alpha/beta hydrolase [Hyphomicrobiaceae bacterium]|jgi:esterase/lipase superfamily enzyme|nr:alpha/beta hydrolase [Hyphomicrobiaceae bacterium]